MGINYAFVLRAFFRCWNLWGFGECEGFEVFEGFGEFIKLKIGYR